MKEETIYQKAMKEQRENNFENQLEIVKKVGFTDKDCLKLIKENKRLKEQYSLLCKSKDSVLRITEEYYKNKIEDLETKYKEELSFQEFINLAVLILCAAITIFFEVFG